jgi:hypothetical protein
MATVAQGASSALAQGDVPPGGQTRLEYPGADTVWVVQQWCMPDGTVGIEVRWNSYNLGIQWFDISHNNNGWIPGTFVGIGALAPWENSMTPWFGIRPNAFTYIRVNTNISGFWYPSSTIQFQTRSDCAYQPPFDSDGDGVPNNQDACPFQPGPSWNNGCPVQQPLDSDGDGVPNNQDACPFQPGPPWNNGCPAGGPPPGGMCDPVTGWCPGQPAPLSRCPAMPQILIFPPPLSGCVWPQKGDAAHYADGENIIFCYWVSQPANVLLQIQLPTGNLQTITQGPDDGRGNCIDPAGSVTIPPSGTRTLRLYGGTNYTQLLDTKTYIAP